MSSIEISIRCARCNRELVVAPPLLFKDSTLKITIMRCDCKDAFLQNKAADKDVKPKKGGLRDENK